MNGFKMMLTANRPIIGLKIVLFSFKPITVLTIDNAEQLQTYKYATVL